MKALILAGGRGKRLGEKTASTNKCLLELASRPALEYNLDRAAAIPGLETIILVVGHRAADIINRYGTSYRGKRVQYVIQWEQKGLVHAIECSTEAIGADDFFLLLGDEVLTRPRHLEMMRAFLEQKIFGVCGVVTQKDAGKIGRTYTALVDGDSRVFRLIEKPKKALNDIQGTGHCIFRNGILSYIPRTPIHPERGEKELPDLIQCAVDDGKIIKIFNIGDSYTNINSEEDLNDARKMLQTD